MRFRQEQQIMNKGNVQNSEDIQYEYGLEDFTTVIGGNNNWYLIYEERDDNLEILDLAIDGSMNSENKKSGHDVKLATMEAFGTLYELFLDAGKKGKKIICNATKDTSLKNIQRMLQKNLIQELKGKNGRKIVYDKEKGLIYEDNGDDDYTNDELIAYNPREINNIYSYAHVKKSDRTSVDTNAKAQSLLNNKDKKQKLGLIYYPLIIKLVDIIQKKSQE